MVISIRIGEHKSRVIRKNKKQEMSQQILASQNLVSGSAAVIQNISDRHGSNKLP